MLELQVSSHILDLTHNNLKKSSSKTRRYPRVFARRPAPLCSSSSSAPLCSSSRLPVSPAPKLPSSRLPLLGSDAGPAPAASSATTAPILELHLLLLLPYCSVSTAATTTAPLLLTTPVLPRFYCSFICYYLATTSTITDTTTGVLLELHLLQLSSNYNFICSRGVFKHILFLLL